ncbi:hypothetical protein SAMN05421837_102407 [Amycolatopsis pretoriensis]|uniref:Uncharacterized protein n=1 Tax=Amycolatopsis pretoriensis TaxID=218821 RepID=A0A1H5QCF4_9PSEU|nr:helix-turn-helix transcriptional regulator [Amycolatopsis pretoriensis]SEF23780.1 hypothetical protein SAMN05421837_102407 [Amycolatopsis pretoriensis]
MAEPTEQDPVDQFAARLRELRLRAGEPSVSRLVALTRRQGRRMEMTRSTIQDKLSGHTTPKLEHVLALVKACVEHAESLGRPLPADTIDEQDWRERWAVLQRALAGPRRDGIRATHAVAEIGSESPAPRQDRTDDTVSVPTIFRRVGVELARRLIHDENGDPVGWCQDLTKNHAATALSTAYGLKTMLVVEEPYVDLGAVTHSLLRMRTSSGAWVGPSSAVRPEVTATVLDALFRVGTPMPVDSALALIERSVDAFTATRPFLLATVLRTVARLRPDAPLATRLVNDLLAARLNFDGMALWPEKVEPGLASPRPSAAHTALAVAALRAAHADHRADVREAIDQSTPWLLDTNWAYDGAAEEITRRRQDGQGLTRAFIRHFTPAWVLMALPETPGRLQGAVEALWSRYEPRRGLWAWGNGDLPVWMTLDAVTALRAVALSSAPRLGHRTLSGPVRPAAVDRPSG